ncbi:MAG: hypothetical protein AAF581_03070 [Planctomycetota bacterium]
MLLVLGVPTVVQAALFRLQDGSDLAAAYISEVGDVITVLTEEGKRRELQRSEVVWVDGRHRLSDRLEQRAAEMRLRFLKKRRKEASRIARRLSAKKKPEQRAELTEKLDEFAEVELLPALSELLGTKKFGNRDYALKRLAAFKTDLAVIPLVQDSLTTGADDEAAVTHEMAVQRNDDLARRLYEYSAQVSPFSQRLRAVGHLQSIGSRAAAPTLVRVLRYVQTTVRVQLARSTGLKEIPVSLGSGGQSVVIETPGIELIQVMTSAEVPVEVIERLQQSTIAALQSISGQEHGADLKSWERWLNAQPPAAKNEDSP